MGIWGQPPLCALPPNLTNTILAAIILRYTHSNVSSCHQPPVTVAWRHRRGAGADCNFAAPKSCEMPGVPLSPRFCALFAALLVRPSAILATPLPPMFCPPETFPNLPKLWLATWLNLYLDVS